MNVKLFWFGDKDSWLWPYRWGMRGIAITRPRYNGTANCTVNVHWIDLAFLRGVDWRRKRANGVLAWKTVLTLGLRVV